MKPSGVQFVVGLSGYFVKDLEAVRRSPTYDPLVDNIVPCTPGFQNVVQAGQVISVLLRLPNNQLAVGDCVDVIFSGAASRDPVFVANEQLPCLESIIKPWLLSCDLSQFRPNAIRVGSSWPELQNRKLHTAIQYGLSQALLSATAQINGLTLAEVISREWGTIITHQPVDILASCHRNDLLQLDRMIMKEVPMLPHASFVHVHDLGPRAISLLEYVRGVAQRVQQRGRPGYHPRLHFDVYGTLGDIFHDMNDLASFLDELQQAARPFQLLIESPIIAQTKVAQIQQLKCLRLLLQERSIPVQIVADEWCNTLEDIKEFADSTAVDYLQVKMPDLGSIHNSIDAVLYCNTRGVSCCLGGSANETDVSARITAQVALATQPNFLLSKPGIGADEGLMILKNEMLRTVAVIRASSMAKI